MRRPAGLYPRMVLSENRFPLFGTMRYPRRPLVAMPFMMWRRSSVNTISIGRMEITAPAEIGPYSMKNWRW